MDKELETVKAEIIPVHDKALAPIDISGLLTQVIEKGPEAIQMLEGLLALQENQQKKIALAEFNKAKALCQSKLPSVKKTHEVWNKNKTAVTYRYANLDDARRSCLPTICGNGFADSWQTENKDNGILVTYTVRHDLGHEESTSMFCPMEQSGYMNAIQRSGSTITYGKRYTFCDFWGIILDEDNDGRSGKGPDKQPMPPKRAPAGPSKLQTQPAAIEYINNNVPNLDSPEAWDLFEKKCQAAGCNPADMEHFYFQKSAWDDKIKQDLHIANSH